MLSTYLNVEGLLARDFRLDVKRAVESRFHLSAHLNATPGPIEAELRDAQGVVLLRQPADWRFPEPCNQPSGLGTPGWLRVSIPRHPDGAELSIVREGRVLWRQEIAASAPSVSLKLLSVSGDKATFTVSAKPASAAFEAMLIDERGRARPVNAEIRQGKLTVMLRAFAGSGTSRLRVVATQDLRSVFADSAPFATPTPVTAGRILAPRQGEELAPDQPVSLIGNVSIAQNGLPLDWAAAKPVWVVDGSEQPMQGDCVAIDAMPPGDHVIELRQGVGSLAQVLHKVTVKVRGRSALQAELDEALKRLAASQSRRVVAVPAATSTKPAARLRTGAHAPCKCC